MSSRFGISPFVERRKRITNNCILSFVSVGMILGCVTVLFLGTTLGCMEGHSKWKNAQCLVVDAYSTVQGCKAYCLTFDVEVTPTASNATYHILYTCNYGDFQDWDEAKKQFPAGKKCDCYFDYSTYEIKWPSGDGTEGHCRQWIVVTSILGGITLIVGILIPITTLLLGPLQ